MSPLVHYGASTGVLKAWVTSRFGSAGTASRVLEFSPGFQFRLRPLVEQWASACFVGWDMVMRVVGAVPESCVYSEECWWSLGRVLFGVLGHIMASGEQEASPGVVIPTI